MNDDHERLRAVGRKVDLDLAIRCIDLSKLAYLPADTGSKVAQRWGYRTYAGLTRRDGRDYAAVLTDDELRYVVFRGTDHHSDWRTNLTLWPTVTRHGAVHRGYYGVCAAFVPELIEMLRSSGDTPTIFTGHSMGGALALLAALELQASGITLHSIYTFGQPRTGARQFHRAVHQQLRVPYLRFVHGADAIAAWGLGERVMLGKPCYFDVRGRLQFGRKLEGMPRLSFRMHRLENYRFYLRLNKLKLQALEESQDVTLVTP